MQGPVFGMFGQDEVYIYIIFISDSKRMKLTVQVLVMRSTVSTFESINCKSINAMMEIQVRDAFSTDMQMITWYLGFFPRVRV